MVTDAMKRAHEKYRKTEKGKINRRRIMRVYRLNLRMKVIKLLGGKCSNPYNFNHGDFEEDLRCLQIDHVNGGGNKEHKLGPNSLYRKILKDPTGYQLLCANCNWIKRDINGE